MNKQKILAYTLSAIIAINTLGASCTKVPYKNEINIEIEESKNKENKNLILISKRYIVDQVPASALIKYNGNEKLSYYYLPKSMEKLGFYLIGHLAIKVECLSVYISTDLNIYKTDGTINYELVYDKIESEELEYITKSYVLNKEEVIEHFKNHTNINGEPQLKLQMK